MLGFPRHATHPRPPRLHGRPSGAAAFDPRWRTEAAVTLALGVIKEVALGRLPVLADALEDAGCTGGRLLRHCRECGEHTTRCWVLGAVLGRAAAVEPPRMSGEQVRREVERVTGRLVASTDTDWRPRRGWLWRLLPLLIAAAVLAAVRAGVGPLKPAPHTHTSPTADRTDVRVP